MIFRISKVRTSPALKTAYMQELGRKNSVAQMVPGSAKSDLEPGHSNQMKMFREREGTFIEYGSLA